jgi:hypothetical protein
MVVLVAAIAASGGFVAGYYANDDTPPPAPDRVVGIRHGCSLSGVDVFEILELWGREVCDVALEAWEGTISLVRRYAEVTVRTASGDTYTVEVENPSPQLDVGDVWFKP